MKEAFLSCKRAAGALDDPLYVATFDANPELGCCEGMAFAVKPDGCGYKKVGVRTENAAIIEALSKACMGSTDAVAAVAKREGVLGIPITNVVSRLKYDSRWPSKWAIFLYEECGVHKPITEAVIQEACMEVPDRFQFHVCGKRGKYYNELLVVPTQGHHSFVLVKERGVSLKVIQDFQKRMGSLFKPVPDGILYHYTSPANTESIEREGIMGGKQRKLEVYATSTATPPRFHESKVVYFEIRIGALLLDNPDAFVVKTRRGDFIIWTSTTSATFIPPSYISLK